MASTDLSTDLFLERLEPAPSLRGAQSQSSPRDAEIKPRRRPSSDEESEDDLSPDADGQPKHKVDSLA